MKLSPRLGPILRFFADRLKRGHYLGLHLTIGVMIIVISGWWFGGVAEDILTNDPLVVIDKQLSGWFDKHAVPVVTTIARQITFLGSVLFITVSAILTGVFFAWRRSWYRLATLVLASGGGSVLNLLLKQSFHRERPVFEHPLVSLESYSFPSGHTMGATLFYGLLAVFLFQSVRRWRWRVLAVVLSTGIIGLIGVSRIYLGAHYLSDVLGAMAVGFAWLSLCVTVVKVMRKRPPEMNYDSGRQ